MATNKPSGLRPPTKVFSTRPQGLPLGSSNVNNVPNAAGGEVHQPGGLSSQPSPSASTASLHSKDYSSTSVDSSNQLRRSNDGAVLNSDTDTFIIGETVFVGGEKRGRIAFLGETQFGKGEWGGIVLDEAIGKNDGSVSGVRYFQCPANHGVFCRLTRLTRQQLSPYSAELSKYGSGTPRQTSPTTPRIFKSPSPDSRPTSRLGSPGPQLKINERVIVQSSTGTKKGILRYVGSTDFAKGDWAGVELDTPVGKNDGSVGGRKYFECRPQFGLFAPIHKVSSSPANRHSAGGGLRRHGSRESMTSNLSSVASSLPYRGFSSRSVLKEKERHLEHLLQEKELDRQELAQAMLKLEGSNKEVFHLRAQHVQFDESLKQNSAIQSEFSTMKAENETLKNSVEEFQRRYDDLLFKYEEDQISRAEIQAQLDACKGELLEVNTKQTPVENIQVDEVKVKLDSVVKENGNLSLELQKCRQELQAQSLEISNLRSSLLKAEGEAASTSDTSSVFEHEIKKLTQTVDELNAQLTSRSSELETLNIQQTQNEEKYKSEVENLRKSFEDLQQQNLKFEHLANELDATNTVLKAAEADREHALEKMKMEHERHVTELNNIQKALNESQIKCNDLQAICDTFGAEKKEQMVQITDDKLKIENLVQNLNKSEEKVNMLENMLRQAKIESEGTTSQIEAKTKELIEQLNNEAQIRTKQIESLSSQVELMKVDDQKHVMMLHSKEKTEAELKETVQSSSKKIEVLLSEIEELKVKSRTDLESEIGRNVKLSQELEMKQAEEVRLSDLLGEKDAVHNAVKLDLENLTKELDEKSKCNQILESELKKKMNDEENHTLEFKTKLETQEEVRRKLNAEVEIKNSEIEKLNQKLNISNEKIVRLENNLEQYKLEAHGKEQQTAQHVHHLEELISTKNIHIEKLVSEQTGSRAKSEESERISNEKEGELDDIRKELNLLKTLNKKLTKDLETSKSQEIAIVEAHHVQISRMAQSHNDALQKLESMLKQNEETISRLNAELHNKKEKESDKSAAPLSTNSEAHVNFLNSIIVDLQNEKQQLNDKLQILLAGGPDANSNVESAEKSTKLSQLRLYCDICETFDQHDTEDCPKQANDPPDENSKHGIARGSERPYCDICEVFGHKTSDCDDAETF